MRSLVRLCMLLMFILAACSPVKQVLNNPKYFKEVADSVVKRGYCINDTVIETKYKEVVTVKETLVHDSSFVHDLQSVVDFDTTFPSGVRVSIDSGKIKVFCPQKEKTINGIKTVTQTVRDRKLEEILNGEIKTLKSMLDIKETECQRKEITIGQLQNKVTALTFKIYVFIFVIILYIAYRVYNIFKPF